jgi:hypothetical protein
MTARDGRSSLPGDLDLALDWKPETELSVVPIDDEVSSHALIGAPERCA